MTERIVQFGPDGALNGILRDNIDASETGVLLFNAGVVHRVGPHRLNVKIARAIAAPSLRFDLAGQGESPSASAGLGYEEQACADIGAAVATLKAETGADNVIAIGLCSGADHAVRAAVADPRISGLVLLDPYAYPNDSAARADFRARAADPDRWARKIRMLMATKHNADEEHAVTDDGDALPQGRPIPPKETFAGDLQTLVNRGVRILIVYTGLVRQHVSEPAHFFEAFEDYNFRGRIDVETMPRADHTFTALDAQQSLIATLDAWRRRRFVSPALSAAS